MLKNLSNIHHQSENISNLSSASNEASVSSSNRNDINGGTLFSPSHYTFSAPQPLPNPPLKKKRNQPGHPDPDAEVIALSPRSLLATNRFVCEICNKGFQRDQNLQLHRRGHNLPWKLKQRSNKDVIRKKVYVCPETSCVHHDPSRALGDLTGIKKHFCRKHGEKKWKCEKCSKKYAVQSDWKAHSKTCGTREYRCDCGTLFSRRDSFITHRAFCDALAEESAKNTTTAAVAAANIIPLHHHQTLQNNHTLQQQIQSQINTINPNHHHHHQLPIMFPIKKEQQNNFMMNNLAAPPDNIPLPQWLSSSSPSIFQDFQDFSQITHQNPNPKPTAPHLPPYPNPPPPPPHISATALLQKAAQMGAKTTCPPPPSPSPSPSPACAFTRPHHQPPAHVSTGFGLNLSSRDGFINGLAAYGNKAANANATVTGGGGSITGAGGGAGIITNPSANPNNHSYLFHDAMMGNPGTFDHDHGSAEAAAFEDMTTFGGMLMSHTISKKEGIVDEDQESLDFHAALDQFSRSRNDVGTNEGINDGMTRDFLGLRALSQSDILSIAGLSSCMDSNSNNNNNNNACNDQH